MSVPMQQIPLAIGPEAAPSFESFVAGANLAAFEHLRQLAMPAAPVYLWGERGCGKTHLLRSLVQEVHMHGQRSAWFSALDAAPGPLSPDWALVVMDDCHALDAQAQQAAFALFVDAAAHGVQVLAAGRLPPVDLPLRDDLRTRLAWGHVFAMSCPNEAESRAVLRREADRRGILLSDEVLNFLLTRFPRDLKSLMTVLDELDEFALSRLRSVTVPLLRQMLAQREGASAQDAMQVGA
jgi:DnaA-homolog protein